MSPVSVPGDRHVKLIIQNELFVRNKAWSKAMWAKDPDVRLDISPSLCEEVCSLSHTDARSSSLAIFQVNGPRSCGLDVSH